ncbi:MAG: glutathione S-transferase family protein [Gemmatimonadota bacterium]
MIRLLEFHRSPNCAKVRIGLRFKGLDFETEELSAADRSPLREAANWPLVPVLLDGRVSMRESEAILHYLESNYREGPSLTPDSADGIREGEAAVLEARWRLRPILRKVYGLVMRPAEERDLSLLQGLPVHLREALAPVDRALEGKDFLLGERMSLYDVVLACALLPLRPNPLYAAQSPIWAFFGEHLSLPDGVPHVAPWVDRVAAHDA